MSRKAKKYKKPFVDMESYDFQRGYPREYAGIKIDQGVYYQNTAHNLAEWKRLQWNTTYYCLLLDAAFVGLNSQPIGKCISQLLPILVLVVSFVGLRYVVRGQINLRDERRKRAKNAYFLAGLYWWSEPDKAKYARQVLSFWKDSDVFWLLAITILAGGTITFFVLFPNFEGAIRSVTYFVQAIGRFFQSM